METDKGHTATNESPKLCVVDLPIDLGSPEPSDVVFQSLRNKQEGQFYRRKQRTYKGKKLSSKYKGVCWRKRCKCWRAKICLEKHIHLGNYEDEKEAALAYDKAALQLFGEYARTNQMMFPEDFSPKSKTSI